MKILTLCALILLATCIRSRAEEPKLDCAAIRYYVAVHGRAAALAWAVRNGYSLREIAEARRCLARG
jgi:hypothetical protein